LLICPITDTADVKLDANEQAVVAAVNS
jgi:hypothetical protein